jgi:hypothetical protein
LDEPLGKTLTTAYFNGLNSLAIFFLSIYSLIPLFYITPIERGLILVGWTADGMALLFYHHFVVADLRIDSSNILRH